MATLGTLKNRPAKASKPEEGTIYLDSSGNWYKAPEITADKIRKSLDNVYLSGVLNKIQRLLFTQKVEVEVNDSDGKPDEELSNIVQKMIGAPDVRLWYTIQRAWRDTAEWGPALINPVWDYVDSEYRLMKLRRLPPESFSTSGSASSTIKNKLLPGIILNQETQEVEFYQKQMYGRTQKLENVVMLTDPLSGEFGGVPLILPIIPLISMIDFSWQSRMKLVNRMGAGGHFFIKVTNPRGDDKAFAQKILRNISQNTAYQLRENMEIINLSINETSTAADTIDALHKLILDHFSPASFISKDGSLISGSSGPEWEMYQAYLRGTHQWIEEAFEQMLQPYLDGNAYEGYTINLTIPSPTIDNSEFMLAALSKGHEIQALKTDEKRQILMKVGLPIEELDEQGMAELKAEYQDTAGQAAQDAQTLQAVANLVRADEMDPEHLIDQDTARKIVNKALKLE